MGSSERPGATATGSTGARGAFLLVVALILGVVILQQFDDGGVPFSQQVSTDDTRATATTRRPSVSVLPPTSAKPVRPNDQVKVLAANGTSTAGLAGKVSQLLTNNNYNALAPTDATRVIEATLVEYKPDFEAEARSLAQLLLLPGSSVRPMEDNPPVAETRDADIIVIIGPDLRLPGESTTSTTRRG